MKGYNNTLNPIGLITIAKTDNTETTSNLPRSFQFNLFDSILPFIGNKEKINYIKHKTYDSIANPPCRFDHNTVINGIKNKTFVFLCSIN